MRERDLDDAKRRADEALERAEQAAAREADSRGGLEHDYAGKPPEHEPEEIDQPPRQ